MSEISDLARGKWKGILGRYMTERLLAGKHGPCPMCHGKDRFRFDDKGGNGTWICNHCGAGDGFHLLMNLNGWDFPQAARHVEQVAGRIKPGPVKPSGDADAKAKMQRIWAEASAVQDGDPVSLYLTRRCGGVPDTKALRCHPSLAHYDADGAVTHWPAMLALVAGSHGRGVSVHRTYLTAEGDKAPVDVARKLMTPHEPMVNVSVRLAPVRDGWLGIAEGIETALCASQLYSIPTWSCISAGMLETFEPPEGLTMLTIFADNDNSYTGQASAYKLARRLTTAYPDIEVRVLMPIEQGTDFADDYAAREAA